MPTHAKHLLFFTFIAVLASACARTPVATPVPASVDVAAPVDPSWPLRQADYRTTSGSIYLGNLDARIEELSRVVAARDLAVHRTALAGSLYHRYRVVGRLEDAEAALRLLDAAVDAEPAVAEHRLMRAIVRSGFHRFDEALQDLDAAAGAGASPESVIKTQREIRLALGDYESLREDFARSSELVEDFDLLALRADLRLQQGDPRGANFLYRAAQTQYRDVSPVPLSWLHLQQGIAHLRLGEVTDAKRFFAAAHERLPQYYLATEHLAECETLLGNHAVARDLYTQVIAQTGNPEFVAALAGLERAAGNTVAAERLAKQAEQEYAALLERNPAAYAQHAAEFFIEIGKPERADELARENLALRQDVGSWILLAQTAHATGDTARACAARARAVETALQPPELAELDAMAPHCR